MYVCFVFDLDVCEVKKKKGRKEQGEVNDEAYTRKKKSSPTEQQRACDSRQWTNRRLSSLTLRQSGVSNTHIKGGFNLHHHRRPGAPVSHAIAWYGCWVGSKRAKTKRPASQQKKIRSSRKKGFARCFPVGLAVPDQPQVPSGTKYTRRHPT